MRFKNNPKLSSKSNEAYSSIKIGTSEIKTLDIKGNILLDYSFRD